MTTKSIDWTGKSGAVYRYYVVQNLTSWGITKDGGNYCFAIERLTGQIVPVYFGVADNLSARICSHERLAEASNMGRLVVLGHTTPAGENARLAEERDLIQFWNPLLNTHHRSAM